MIGALARGIRHLAGSLLFRVAGTVVVLGIVLAQVDWSLVGSRLGDGKIGWAVLAVLAVDAALVIGALRWAVLLRAAHLEIPTRELYRVYSVTAFANAFLPTSIGGDVARPWLVSRRGAHLRKAIATVIVDRLAALLALLALAWVGVMTVDPDVVEAGSVIALGAVSVGFTCVLGAATVVARSAPQGRARRAVPERARPLLREVAHVARSIARRPAMAVGMVGASLAFQALVTLQIVFLGRAIGVDVSFALAALALALVTVAMLVPVTIGGFGIREGSFVVLLGGAGIAHSDAVLISLLTVVALFVATLPGAWQLVRGGLAPALTEAREHVSTAHTEPSA